MTVEILFPVVTGAVLLLGGITKIGNVQSTLTTFERFRLPAFLIRAPLAAVFPVFELVVAFSLLFADGPTYLAASAAAEISMAAYTLLALRAVYHGDELDCGCFGEAIESPAGWTMVWRNLAFFAIACAGFVGACLGVGGVGSVLTEFTPSDTGWAVALVLATAVFAGLLHSRTDSRISLCCAPAPLVTSKSRILKYDPE